MFLFFFALFGSLFYIACAVFLLEPLDSPGGIDKFLLAGIEWMAHRADFCVNFLCRAARLERVSTAAMNYYLVVFRMYIFFHNKALKIFKFKIISIFADISINFFAFMLC